MEGLKKKGKKQRQRGGRITESRGRTGHPLDKGWKGPTKKKERKKTGGLRKNFKGRSIGTGSW